MTLHAEGVTTECNTWQSLDLPLKSHLLSSTCKQLGSHQMEGKRGGVGKPCPWGLSNMCSWEGLNQGLQTCQHCVAVSALLQGASLRTRLVWPRVQGASFRSSQGVLEIARGTWGADSYSWGSSTGSPGCDSAEEPAHVRPTTQNGFIWGQNWLDYMAESGGEIICFLIYLIFF